MVKNKLIIELKNWVRKQDYIKFLFLEKGKKIHVATSVRTFPLLFNDQNNRCSVDSYIPTPQTGSGLLIACE